MDKQGLLNKISFILQDLKGQHLKLTGNVERIPEIELELFMANARYLIQHLEVLHKVNGNSFDVKVRDEILKNILKEHTETTEALQPPVQPAPLIDITQSPGLNHAILNDFPFPKLDTNIQAKSGVSFENKQGVFAPELERRAAMLAAQNAAEKEVREREAASRLVSLQREADLIKTLNDTYKNEVKFTLNDPLPGIGADVHINVQKTADRAADNISESDYPVQNIHIENIPGNTGDYANSESKTESAQQPEFLNHSHFANHAEVKQNHNTLSGNKPSERAHNFHPTGNVNPVPPEAKVIDLNSSIQGHSHNGNNLDSYQGNAAHEIHAFDLNQADLNNSAPAKNINDLLASQKTGSTLINRLDSLPVKDIRKAVGLNEHLLFIKTLFNGDPKAYDRALTAIDSLKNSQQAHEFISHIASEFNWGSKPAVAELFKNIVNRKFSRS